MQRTQEKTRAQEKLMMTSSAGSVQKSKTGGKEASRKHKDEFNPKPGSDLASLQSQVENLAESSFLPIR